MSQFLISVLAMVVVLGFMILIHEFGHYAVAKFFKVRVEVFSIGFGPRLLGFRKGETDYRIAAIPLGGYVKMSGENPMDERTGDPGEFLSHPRWQRFFIAIAGPAMNIFLAIFLLTAVYKFHYEYPEFADQPAVIGWIMDGSAAQKAGLEVGDRIAKLGDVDNPSWEQAGLKAAMSPGQPLNVSVERDGKIEEKTLTPETEEVSKMGYAGWVPKQSPLKVTRVEPGMPAEKAGLQPGDVILTADGRPIPVLEALIDTLKRTKDKPIELSILRNGESKTLTLQPVLTESATSREKVYRIGVIGTLTTKIKQLPLSDAFHEALDRNKSYSMLILELVQKLVQGKISIRSVEGPIRIGQAAGQAAVEKGWTPLLELTAMISLNLGIFNLLPIPILDGGVILFLLVESLMRRDINLRIKERIYQAAFVFLVLFAVTVLYNDLMKTIPGLAQRLP